MPKFGSYLSNVTRIATAQIDRRFAPEIVGMTAAIAIAVRLLFPTPVTMADNGDGGRLLCAVHAAPSSRHWAFAVIHYEVLSNQKCGGYASVQLLPTMAVAWLHRSVLGLSGAFDARELIILYCLIVGAVIATLLRTLSRIAPMAKMLIALVLFILAGDATFADYAGSPYTETAALYGVLIFAVAAVALVGREVGQIAAFMAAWAGALLIVGAKTETATLAIPLCGFFAFRKGEIKRVSHRLGSRVLPAVSVASIAFTAFWALGGFSPDGNIPLEKVNVSNEVTMTVMPLSKDPGDVATELGLPRRFGEYSGSSWWSSASISNDPEYSAIAGKLTQANLAHYFILHPGMSAKVFADGSQSYLAFRNNYIGTYAESAGHMAGDQEQRLTVATDTSRAFRGLGIGAVISFWALCAASALWLFRRSSQDPTARGFALVATILLSFDIMQYVASVYGDGNEVTKHLVVGLLAGSIAPVWLIAGAIHLRWKVKEAAVVESLMSSVLPGAAEDEGLTFSQGSRP